MCADKKNSFGTTLHPEYFFSLQPRKPPVANAKFQVRASRLQIVEEFSQKSLTVSRQGCFRNDVPGLGNKSPHRQHPNRIPVCGSRGSPANGNSRTPTIQREDAFVTLHNHMIKSRRLNAPVFGSRYAYVSRFIMLR